MGSGSWDIAPFDRAAVTPIAQTLGVRPLVAHLLRQRGAQTVDEARDFLNPLNSPLADPFLLTDMAKAVCRLEQARDRQEKVMVFGDYDVDGISGTAIMIRGLRRFGIEQCTPGIPGRLTEGYGLSLDHIDQAAEQGTQLIVTVDNGINNREAARRCRELGIDLIITDHHQIEGDLPDAVAIVNPKREPETFGGYHLCGAAVAFKVVTALTGTEEDLDLVALGTVADIVPLLRENRALVARGLRHMRRTRRLGIDRLVRIADISMDSLTSEDLAFQIAPRINAVGRLGDGHTALDLLLTESAAEADSLARTLNRANEERRAIEDTIFEDAVAEIEATLTSDQRSIVLARDGWHPGVIGIVAARILHAYNRPVALIAIDDDGLGRASARSAGGFDLVAALAECRQHLERFGGHQAAAGFSLTRDNVEAFAHDFEQVARDRIPGDGLLQTVEIDAIVALTEVDSALIAALEHLQPFGHGNPSPVLCTMNATPLYNSVRVFKDRHLRFAVRQGPNQLTAIGFNMNDRTEAVALSRSVDLVFTPKLNTFRGETTIQLHLKDVRPAQSGASC